MNSHYQVQSWMKYTLVGAGALYLISGTFAAVAPSAALGGLGVEATGLSVDLWRGMAVVVAALGVGYLVASRDAYQHWLMIAVGGLCSLCLSVVCGLAVSNGTLPGTLGAMFIVTAAALCVPFAMIVWGAIRYTYATDSAHVAPESDDPLRALKTNTGQRLDDLANASPQMVVFLRHAGCTFCRQTLADISKQRSEIEATGCGIVFVHLGDESEESAEIFRRYGVEDLPRISDTECRLYRQFGLDLGGFSQLFGLRVWVRGLIYGMVNGHGLGSVRGNSFQMPGVYLYHCGVILGGFRHEAASDRPNYVDLAKEVQLEPQAIAG